jgi:hypothetical protein
VKFGGVCFRQYKVEDIAEKFPLERKNGRYRSLAEEASNGKPGPLV